jgi:ethanolamine transporter EutH
MDYRAMWKEMRDHLKTQEEVCKVMGLADRASTAGMFSSFMKVIEQEHLYKNVRQEGKVVNYDFQNQG